MQIYLSEYGIGIITIINGVIKGLNHVKVPDWVPGIGGAGINLREFNKVPYLATGAVIPANKPFQAVLGDQKNGTNLEAPEDLVRQIVREESGTGNAEIIYLLEKLIAVVESKNLSIDKKSLFNSMEQVKSQRGVSNISPNFAFVN